MPSCSQKGRSISRRPAPADRRRARRAARPGARRRGNAAAGRDRRGARRRQPRAVGTSAAIRASVGRVGLVVHAASLSPRRRHAIAGFDAAAREPHKRRHERPADRLRPEAPRRAGVPGRSAGRRRTSCFATSPTTSLDRLATVKRRFAARRRSRHAAALSSPTRLVRERPGRPVVRLDRSPERRR